MIFFFYGPNSFAARRQIGKLITQYKEKSGGDFGLERIDGAKARPEELNAALQAMPFLANSRLVIIEDLGANKALSTKIADYIKDVPPTTVAVFYDSAVDQRTSYFKTVLTQAKTVKFELLATPKLQQWVAGEATAHQATIERPAIARLLVLAGEDQWRLSNELAKLAAYNSDITVETVNELVEEAHTETIFTLVEAMTAGNSSTALKLYRQLKTEGQNEMYILNMVTWQLRNLLLAKAAGKITPLELAKTAGMSPFVATKMLNSCRRLTEPALKTGFLQAVDTDYQIKSGNTKADVAVEQLIYHVADRSTA